MSLTKSFTVGSLSINAAMASAIEQDEVLSLVSSEVIQRAAIAARSKIEMGESVLVSMFFSMPSQVKQRVAAILLNRAFAAGTSKVDQSGNPVEGTARKVTVADFQGKMVEYNTLLAQLTLWNFEDFFTYLSDAVRNAAPAQEETAP